MTILFLQDWDSFPNAIIDTKTKNQSFIRMAALYKEMGIKNHAFPLQLHNPELQDIDPFDSDLTLQQIAMIAIEAKQNPYYYFREIARDPKGTIENPRLFKANRGNMTLYWLFFNHVMTILIQPRQTGKSFSVDELFTWLFNLRCTKTQINLLTKDDTLRAANLERLKEIEQTLPFYLKMRTKGDIGNTEELTIKALGNSYRGHLPNKSIKMAMNVGRGLTSPIFQCDEAAYFYNIDISLPAALAAGTAARDIAKVNNDPYGTILTTTAGKRDSREGGYVYRLLSDSAVWTEKFLDAKDIHELEWLIKQNSPKREIRVNCTFSHRQLGYTDEWLKQAMRAALNEGEDAERDFLNRWTSGNATSPLPVELMEIIKNSQENDFYSEISPIGGYITRWYINESAIEYTMDNQSTILSIDSSDAVGNDAIGLTLRSINTGDVLAASDINETNLIKFCEWLVDWLVRFKRSTLIIERRSSGATIIDYLLLMLPSKGVDPFARLFNKAVQDKDEYPDRYAEIAKPLYSRSSSVYVKYKKLFGFTTSGSGDNSRDELYGLLLPAAKVTGSRVKDSVLINQILGLVIRNGRIDHQIGGNDDLCVSWLMSMWLLVKGKNLSHYGISPRDILVDSKYNKEVNTPESVFKQNRQQQLRNEIENLVNSLQSERDEFISYKYENKLRLLASELSVEDKQILSVDSLINNIKENKKINKLNRSF